MFCRFSLGCCLILYYVDYCALLISESLIFRGAFMGKIHVEEEVHILIKVTFPRPLEIKEFFFLC